MTIASITKQEGIKNAFSVAKTRLWDGNPATTGEQFICLSLPDSPWKDEAEDIIMNRLGGHYCIEFYLSSVGIPENVRTSRDVQTFRHLWLDSLIKEFSA